MKINEIDDYIENQCKLYGLPYEKRIHSNGFNLFEKEYSKAKCWVWNGETGKKALCRFDFVIVADKSVFNTMCSKVQKILENRRYGVKNEKASFRISFVPDIDLTYVNMEVLGEAMLDYMKFFKNIFPEIDKILNIL